MEKEQRSNFDLIGIEKFLLFKRLPPNKIQKKKVHILDNDVKNWGLKLINLWAKKTKSKKRILFMIFMKVLVNPVALKPRHRILKKLHRMRKLKHAFLFVYVQWSCYIIKKTWILSKTKKIYSLQLKLTS